MRKTVFLFIIFALTTANGMLVEKPASLLVEDTVSPYEGYADSETPLGEGEENSESSKDVSEDDDDAGLDHRWLSREQSSNSDLHFLYQEILFHNLELSIVIPPPKA
jgi:hypothetical protein